MKGAPIMKTTGVVRCIDELGRLVVPKEMRRKLGIAEGDPLEIHMEGDTIVIKKDINTCVFCGGTDSLSIFHGKNICESCLSELKS